MSFSPLERSAKRMRIYVSESDLWRGRPLYAALLDLFKKEGLAGATVIRGVAGFGAHSRIHTAAILRLSEDLPLVIEVIDSADKIRQVLQSVSVMVREGLVTLEDVEVLAYTHRYLHPLPADRRVREIMTRDPLAVQAGLPLVEVWTKMLNQSIKALPVLDDAGRVVGILTHADLMERAGLNARLAAAQRLDETSLAAEMAILHASGLTARDVMSQPPVTVHPDDSITLAAERLVSRSITRLPVVDENGKLLGMLSRLDLLRQVMDSPEKPASPSAPPGSGRLVGEIMAHDVPKVREDTGLSGVIAAFLAGKEHRVIVVNASDEPVGLISDSDVVGRIQPPHRRGVLDALRGRTTIPDLAITAAALMSPGVETVTAGTPVVTAVQHMLRTGRHWLVVVDAAGKVAGLVDRELALRALVRYN